MMHATDLTKSLPSSEEILRAVGLQRARNGSDLLGGVAVFGAGILVGAGLALLFAPTSGAEVREQIGSKLEDVRRARRASEYRAGQAHLAGQLKARFRSYVRLACKIHGKQTVAVDLTFRFLQGGSSFAPTPGTEVLERSSSYAIIARPRKRRARWRLNCSRPGGLRARDRGQTMSVMPPMGYDGAQFFAPDIITPEQYADRMKPASADRPEIRLMLAVMENGIATYLRYALDACIPAKRRARRLFGEAKAWVESDDISWPYSFANLCTALGFDVSQMRRGLESLQGAGVTEAPMQRISVRRINGSRHVIGAGSERRRPRRSARERRASRRAASIAREATA